MANELSSAGVKLKYAVEATAGTRPTTGYTALGGLVEIPDINEAPAQLDCTSLDNTEYKSYIPGLKDTGGALTFRFNQTSAFKTAWEAMVTAYTAGAAASPAKATWFEVMIPTYGSFYFAGIPSDLGLSQIGVDEVLQIDAYITANDIHGWDTSST